MRNWCVTVVVGALLALPLCAQQKDASTASKTKGTTESTATANATASDFSIAPASPTLFAMPAAAAPKPADIFSDWANNAWNRHAWGRLTPKFEIAGMYQYMNFNPGSGYYSFNNNGATGSFTYNANNWLGLTAEVGGYHFGRKIVGAPITTATGTIIPINEITGSLQTYLFGPRVNFRHFDHFVPFAEVMFGAAHGGAQLTGDTTQSTFAMAAGGGVDVVLTKHLAWRFFEADYLMTNFSGSLLNAEARQNNFRIGTGVVLRWAYPPIPPKPNHPPVASCSATPTSVYQGSSEPVTIHVAATDADNDPLTYSYTASGGTVDGTGPDVRWNPSGLALGSYTVNAKVDDGKGGTATCAADVAVNKRPNRPPVISCAPARSPINPGERVAINSTASDPDGDPLTYSYSTTGGQVSGTGPSAQFDSTGLAMGSYTVTCTADDGQGGRTSATTAVEVKEPPEIKELERRLSLHDVYFPTAQPTPAKPNGGLLASQQTTLDTLASDFTQYLTHRPEARLLLEGHADSRGPKEFNQKLSERRAQRTKSYLIEKGVPADHIDTKAYGEERNMTSDEVKKLIEDNPDVSAENKQKLIKNIETVRMANNRRVDVTLIGKDGKPVQEGLRLYPFNAADSLTLLSRSGPGTAKAEKPAAKTAPKPAPKKAPKP
jgi:outer membrane protein OmpA-like peptidoglycan-associated protein